MQVYVQGLVWTCFSSGSASFLRAIANSTARACVEARSRARVAWSCRRLRCALRSRHFLKMPSIFLPFHCSKSVHTNIAHNNILVCHALLVRLECGLRCKQNTRQLERNKSKRTTDLNLRLLHISSKCVTVLGQKASCTEIRCFVFQGSPYFTASKRSPATVLWSLSLLASLLFLSSSSSDLQLLL